MIAEDHGRAVHQPHPAAVPQHLGAPAVVALLHLDHARAVGVGRRAEDAVAAHDLRAERGGGRVRQIELPQHGAIRRREPRALGTQRDEHLLRAVDLREHRRRVAGMAAAERLPLDLTRRLVEGHHGLPLASHVGDQQAVPRQRRRRIAPPAGGGAQVFCQVALPQQRALGGVEGRDHERGADREHAAGFHQRRGVGPGTELVVEALGQRPGRTVLPERLARVGTGGQQHVFLAVPVVGVEDPTLDHDRRVPVCTQGPSPQLGRSGLRPRVGQSPHVDREVAARPAPLGPLRFGRPYGRERAERDEQSGSHACAPIEGSCGVDPQVYDGHPASLGDVLER